VLLIPNDDRRSSNADRSILDLKKSCWPNVHWSNTKIVTKRNPLMAPPPPPRYNVELVSIVVYGGSSSSSSSRTGVGVDLFPSSFLLRVH
jgi:hypothetical protein